MNSEEQLSAWFAGRLPEDWFAESPKVVVDREEISVLGTLPPLSVAEGLPDVERAAAMEGYVERFREETRERRIDIAREASTASAARSPGASSSATRQ